MLNGKAGYYLKYPETVTDTEVVNSDMCVLAPRQDVLLTKPDNVQWKSPDQLRQKPDYSAGGCIAGKAYSVVAVAISRNTRLQVPEHVLGCG
jgi:hypothetical protein